MSTPKSLLSSEQARLLREQADGLPCVVLQAHELAALELLMQGALAPLDGFNTRASATRPLLPLQVSGLNPQIGAQLALHDSEGVTLAVLRIEQVQRDGDLVSVGGPVHALQIPTRELFSQFRIRVDALRDRVSSAHNAQAICVHVRGDFDEQSCLRIRACGEKTRVLLRVLDGGDPDRAHQVKHAIKRAQRVREQFGNERCVTVVSPDPSPARSRAQQALDECYARNIGCSSNIWLDSARAEQNAAHQGICVFFTGFSGSGKSTLARALHAHIVENTERAVTLLDGDVVRQHLSRGLGFSRADRDLNVLRIGYVASRVVMHGGVVICAPIAPYAKTRAAVRGMVEHHGRFIEVHVSTALGVCEARDRKGLYAKARAGDIKEFTGVSDPYEVPEHAEFTIDTELSSVKDAVEQIAKAIMHKTQNQ